MAQAPRDQNFVPTILLESSTNAGTVLSAKGDELTGRLLVDSAGGGGTGTVTSVAVATANGFAGTVATPTTTAIITLTTTITGLLKGDGTSISAATAGTDYVTASSTNTFTNKTYDTAGSGNSFSINGVAVTANSGTGAVARASSPVFVTPTLGVALATSINGNTFTVGTYTLTGQAGKTLTFNGSITLTGTDAQTYTFPTTTATLARTDTGQTFTGTNAFGVITATSLNGNFFTAGTYTLTGQAGKTLTFNGSITLTGTDAQTYTFPTTTATLARTDSTQTFTGVQNFTSPDTTTSITTSTTSFTAWAGATTLLTFGGTGASASTFMPSTLDASSSTTGAIRTSGGISAAKSLNIGTTITGGGNLTIGTSNSATVGTIELGAATDTTLSRSGAGVLAVEGVVIPSISSTNTFTNKFNTPQVQSVADAGGTFTPVSITNDMGVMTALSQATTIAAPTGSPVQGEKLLFRIKDNATARALTWNAIYRASSDLALPSTTIISKTLYVLFVYNSTDTKWDCLAVLNNF